MMQDCCDDLKSLLNSLVGPELSSIPSKYNVKELSELNNAVLLSQGTYHRVYAINNSSSNPAVVVKLIQKKDVRHSSTRKQRLVNEINANLILNHPNIVPFIECFHTLKVVGIVTSFIPGGDLLNFFQNDKVITMTESKIAEVFQKVVRAVVYCHRKNIVHLDLKPENVLYNHVSGTVYLIDFGACGFIKDSNDSFKARVGTELYASPEVLSSNTYSGKTADVWGLGVILYTLVTSGSWSRSSSIPTSVLSSHCRSLLSTMLDTKPEMRIQSKNILSSAYLQVIKSPPVTSSCNDTIPPPLDLQEDTEEEEDLENAWYYPSSSA